MRDRATLYLNLLGDGPEAAREDAQTFLFQGLDVPLANLEASLQAYVSAFIKYDFWIIFHLDFIFLLSLAWQYFYIRLPFQVWSMKLWRTQQYSCDVSNCETCSHLFLFFSTSLYKMFVILLFRLHFCMLCAYAFYFLLLIY